MTEYQLLAPGLTKVLRRSRNHSAGGVEQPRNGAVDLLVLALAIVLENDFSASIDDVLRRPILVATGVPGLVFVVLRDRIGDAMPFQRGLHVGGGSLEWEAQTQNDPEGGIPSGSLEVLGRFEAVVG
jgi:hypothetical protein